MVEKRLWRALLFDFDYTLVDSSAGIIACANDALAQMGLAPAAPERICATIGLPLAETYTRLTGSEDAACQRTFARLFVAKADEVMVASTSLFPAARTVIPELAQRGYCLGVVSTKYHARLAGVLQRDGLLSYFDVLIGGDQVARQKPAPDGLLYAAERLALVPAACLYLGDTPTDAEAAAAAGMSFVALLSGVCTEKDFLNSSVIAFLPDLAATLAWVTEHESPGG